MLFSCKNLEHLASAAKEVSKHQKHPLILVEGEMGSGKTSFVKMFAKGIGLTENVSSPTFSIIQEYNEDNVTFIHMDLYRLKKLTDFIEIGGEDYLEIPTGFCFIEWPEIIKPILPPNYHKISIKVEGTKRIINFV